jgi:hypothetical protein
MTSVRRLSDWQVKVRENVDFWRVERDRQMAELGSVRGLVAGSSHSPIKGVSFVRATVKRVEPAGALNPVSVPLYSRESYTTRERAEMRAILTLIVLGGGGWLMAAWIAWRWL